MSQAAPTLRGDHSWAKHLMSMEAGGEIDPAAPTTRQPSLRLGLLVCALLAGGAALLQIGAARVFAGHSLDATMFAMLLGIVVGNLGIDPALLRPGARWVVRVVLPLGIMLLGARLHLGDLLGLGLKGLALSAGVIALSGAVIYGVARWQRLPGRLATLLAAGNGICGGAAVVALAPAIDASEDEVAVSVSTLALLGLLGMLLLPPLGVAFGMDPIAFGTWSGLAIQQTAQVIAAGFSHGAEAGEVATIVKLVRISLLAPVVLLVGLTYRLRFEGKRKRSGLGVRGLVPSFSVGLLLLAAIASVGFFPEIAISLGQGSALGAVGTTLHTQSLAIGASKLCLVVGMAAVGLETRWETLRKTGPAAFWAAACGSAVVIAATGIAVSLL
ncbi:MAG: putative sulfate exporter family transporter [Myxococcales bacterium]|nr:putative sulfate exporter family transporter [Myxococcales bacterium]